MTVRQFAAALLSVTSVQSFATADSIGPLLDSRHVDPTGTYYLVVKRDLTVKKPSFSTPVTFEIASRAVGTLPVIPARDFFRFGKPSVPNPDVKVRNQDNRLGRGKLDVGLPSFLVSRTGLGFVAVDILDHARCEPFGVRAVTIVSAGGVIRHRKKLGELFTDKEIASFPRSMIMEFWYDGGWLDERQKQCVLVERRRVRRWQAHHEALPSRRCRNRQRPGRLLGSGGESDCRKKRRR